MALLPHPHLPASYKCQLAPEPNHWYILHNDVIDLAPNCVMDHILYDLQPLLDDLACGDVELRFHDGRSMMAHSQKLKLASKGILRSLMEDVLEEEIHAKCRRMDREGGTYLAQDPDMPGVTVSPHTHACLADPASLLLRGMNVCSFHHAQVDGSYEDWLEVLRLIYYGGEFAHSCCCIASIIS